MQMIFYVLLSHFCLLLPPLSLSVTFSLSLSLSVAVLYCTLLAQAQNEDEKGRIEETMRTDPRLTRILSALEEMEREDIVHEERAQRHAARQSRIDADLDAMEVDVESGGVSIYVYETHFFIE